MSEEEMSFEDIPNEEFNSDEDEDDGEFITPSKVSEN